MAGTDAARDNGMPIRSRRAQKASKRLEALVEKYIGLGLSEEAAKEQAFNDMKDNPRGDWRAG